MRVLAISSIAALAMFGAVGCATTETGSVTETDTGVRAYGLDDQPQTVVAGEGSLMPGAYSSRHMETGQFTGRERTNDRIGQQPLPREADSRALDRDSAPAADEAGVEN